MAWEPRKVTMFVNEFENSNSYRLQQIISTLKNVHGVKLDLTSQSDDQVMALGESSELIKNNIVNESAFNTWMQNPEYTKNMLIVEAVKIYLAEIAPKRMSKKAKKVKESTEQIEEMPSTRSIGSGAVRAWAHDKMDKDRRSGLSMKGYRPKGAPSREDLRSMSQKGQEEYLQRGGKVTREDEELDENSPDSMAGLGRSMMDYAQMQRPDRNDEREMRILNAISQVGDKLTQFGTAFGPRELSDMDKKVIIVAKRRMGQHSMSEDVLAKPGSVTVAKDGMTTTVPPEKLSAELPKLKAQGYEIKGDDEVKEDDMDEGNEFSGALAAAKAKGEKTFKVGDKTYNVDEAESMMEAAKGPDVAKLKKKQVELEKKMDAIIKKGGKVLKNDPLRKQYDKVCADIKAAKKTVTEAAHMEHDDYQASMARSELYRNTKYAMDMMKMIGPNDDVKPWIAANLTKAAASLDKIYHYMDYYMTFEPSEVQLEPDGIAEETELGETTGSIARQNLMMIMEYSTKLFRMIQPGDKLEGWVAMKLTNASESISSSKHHMEYAQFEKHAGEMADDDLEHAESLPVEEETKGKKKNIKEGQMVTIGNLLMGQMLKEDADLQQAQTLLAAKSMSDDLQNMAEKLAKMSVEDLMPLVDVMKEQFGQDIAGGFNEVMKSSLEAVLNAATEAKEATDNAILSMQSGQVPGAATDIEAAGGEEAPAAAPEAGAEGGAEGGDEFGSTPAAAGPAEEPLGRSKKPEGGAVPSPEDLEEGKKMSAKQAAIFGKKSDKKPAAKGDMKGKKCTSCKKGTYQETSQMDDMDGVVHCTKCGKGVKRHQSAKPKEKDVKESKVEEKAPPGKKAEDFIKSSKADFKKRYGKDWEGKLYATAWKKFGPKSESYHKINDMLESVKANKAKIEEAFAAHKRKHARLVNEGITTDVLNTGYGLEGQGLLDQITGADVMISKLKEMMRAEIKSGVHQLVVSESISQSVEKLAESKKTAPWGVVWKDGSKAKQKFFESADLRKYWMDLNTESLTECKLVNPADFDKRINALKSRKG